ncbi:MAG: heme acquisition protein HasAp [Halomonas sp.]|nr:heme acquisition protein HasA [Halomonas sp.]TVP52149.1 MAG: heme acquisition protein HasAp [Halomonas sp.]
MSISYAYDENNFPGEFAVGSLESLLLTFQSEGVSGEHPANTGGFYTGGSLSSNPFSGDTYAMALNGGDFAFSATGDLTYDFPSHTLHGTLETLTLGGGLNNNGTVTDSFITFDFTSPLEGDLADGRENAVHDVIWGLMNGSVEGWDSSTSVSQGGLLAVLDDAGLLNDIIPASVTGVSTSEFDFALAA